MGMDTLKMIDMIKSQRGSGSNSHLDNTQTKVSARGVKRDVDTTLKCTRLNCIYHWGRLVAMLIHNCSSQTSIVHWLSSPIFPCLVGCRPSRYGDTHPNLTSSCPTPPNPYIFWKLMIIAIQKWIRNTNTKTKTNTKTMTKTKTPRE